MALLNPAETLPAGSRDALEIFDERYLMAIGAVQPQTWASELGEVSTTPSLETKYPMTMLSLKYIEARDQRGKFKTIGERIVDLTVAEYSDGVEVELVKLLANAYVARQWADAPARLLQAEQQFVLRTLADMLVANSETCGWDGLTLFNDAHPCNPTEAGSATFDNLQATTKDVANLANIEAEITAMLEVLDENGDPLNIVPDTIIVPRQKWQSLRNLLKQDFVPTPAGTATMRNPYNDSVLNVVRANQLSDNNDWYLADSAMISQGIVPWTAQKLQLPSPGFDELGLRRYEPANSDRAREKGVVGVDSHIYWGFKFLFPHAMRKIAGA